MSLLKTIDEIIPLLIEAMETGDDFNFNWGKSNLFDNTNRPVGVCADVKWLGENPLDDERDNNGGLYDNHADFDIEVYIKYSEAPENPNQEARRDLMEAVDDLKRLFGNNDSLDGNAFDIWRIRVQDPIEYFQDALMPAKMVSRWRVQYSQDRRNPNLPG